MREPKGGGPDVLTADRAIQLGRGAPVSRGGGLRQLLPAEPRSVEIVSAFCMLAYAIYFLLQVPGGTISIVKGDPLPGWDVSVPLFAAGAAHIWAIVFGRAARHIRTSCIFFESCAWAYFAVGSSQIGVYPIPGATAIIYSAMSVAMAWSFLTRMLIGYVVEPPAPGLEDVTRKRGV